MNNSTQTAHTEDPPHLQSMLAEWDKAGPLTDAKVLLTHAGLIKAMNQPARQILNISRQTRIEARRFESFFQQDDQQLCLKLLADCHTNHTAQVGTCCPAQKSTRIQLHVKLCRISSVVRHYFIVELNNIDDQES